MFVLVSHRKLGSSFAGHPNQLCEVCRVSLQVLESNKATVGQLNTHLALIRQVTQLEITRSNGPDGDAPCQTKRNVALLLY